MGKSNVHQFRRKKQVKDSSQPHRLHTTQEICKMPPPHAHRGHATCYFIKKRGSIDIHFPTNPLCEFLISSLSEGRARSRAEEQRNGRIDNLHHDMRHHAEEFEFVLMKGCRPRTFETNCEQLRIVSQCPNTQGHAHGSQRLDNQLQTWLHDALLRAPKRACA